MTFQIFGTDHVSNDRVETCETTIAAAVSEIDDLRARLKAVEQERDLWVQRYVDAIRERNAAYSDIRLLAAEIDAAAERFRTKTLERT